MEVASTRMTHTTGTPHGDAALILARAWVHSASTLVIVTPTSPSTLQVYDAGGEPSTRNDALTCCQ
eukprot:5298737-Alexandrium_andersonii.AAC.1